MLLLLLPLSMTLAVAAVVHKQDRAAGVADDPAKGGATNAQAVVQDAVCLCT